MASQCYFFVRFVFCVSVISIPFTASFVFFLVFVFVLQLSSSALLFGCERAFDFSSLYNSQRFYMFHRTFHFSLYTRSHPLYILYWLSNFLFDHFKYTIHTGRQYIIAIYNFPTPSSHCLLIFICSNALYSRSHLNCSLHKIKCPCSF